MVQTGPGLLRVPAKATCQEPAPWGSAGNKSESQGDPLPRPLRMPRTNARGCWAEWEIRGEGTMAAFSRAGGSVRRTSHACIAVMQGRKVGGRVTGWG